MKNQAIPSSKDSRDIIEEIIDMILQSREKEKTVPQCIKPFSLKILFVCSQNLRRSKTGEDLFKDRYNVKSAGLWCGNSSKTNEVTRDMLQWADVTFVFERMHIDEIKERFSSEYLSKCIINLDIPDLFRRGDPNLKTLINKKVAKVFAMICNTGAIITNRFGFCEDIPTSIQKAI